MILLLGGTTEASSIARELAKEGFNVLLSTATKIPPHGGLGAGIRWQSGELDAQGIEDLIRIQGIRMVVDGTHPYAAVISANAWTACHRTGIPYVAFDRPSSLANGSDIHWAADHNQAANLACSLGKHLLLTIGSRNLAPYVTAARLHNIKLVARVLDHPSSIKACDRAGLRAEEIVCGKGPFSEEENRSLIKRHHIDVLVTKDSGDAGGVGNKITATRNAGCRIVAVKRPPRPGPGHGSVSSLIKTVRLSLLPDSKRQQ